MTPEEQAHAAAIEFAPQEGQSRRRLSWLRMLGVGIALAVIAAGVVGLRSTAQRASAAPPRSSFTPYVDVTATPQYAFENPSAPGTADVVLGFVVSSPGADCQPSWGGAYSLSAASTGMDLDRRIARLRQRGGDATVSFGGAANSELAIKCTSEQSLLQAYKSVVTRYDMTTIDFDIEGDTASAPDVSARRAAAVAQLQASQKAAGHELAVWLTLPVGPDGLTATGRAVVHAMLAAHVVLAGVNALTMDYGQPVPSGQTMATLAEHSLTALSSQLVSLYSATGSNVSADQVWQHLGATAMIGQNDTVSERFELADARELVTFARLHHLLRLSMWSLNRDQTCGPNYANVEIVSDSCSGVSQTPAQFAGIFAGFATGSPIPSTKPTSPSSTGSGSASATPAPTATTAIDNPATSPYAIWNPAQAYPANTKIVWHHNVYEAKWYTQGDTPDAPVATASDTPWTLIGPVLPGDHPAPTPTLSAGTYPAWTAAKIYIGGDRVLYNGVGYQAKWWTQGDVPGIQTTTPSDTPWQQLTS
jgi:chitinase